jgi:FUN14 domain-containing protein 1
MVNLYELTFGTVTGICAGVFIKKGAKMVAFFLGGVFVLLQVRKVLLVDGVCS